MVHVQQPEPYRENPDFVPNPTDFTGTLDTSGTAGAAHGRIEAVTPIFDIAAKQDAEAALRALDPDDDSVDSSVVVLPSGPDVTVDDVDAAKARLRERVESTEDADYGEPNEFEEEAAKTFKEGEEPQGVGGGAPDAHPNGGGDSTVTDGTLDTSGAVTGGPEDGRPTPEDLTVIETGTIDTTGTDGENATPGAGVAKQIEAVEEKAKEAEEADEDADKRETASAYDPSEHKVDEVVAHIEAHPEEKDAIIAAEREGKNRSTITNL